MQRAERELEEAQTSGADAATSQEALDRAYYVGEVYQGWGGEHGPRMMTEQEIAWNTQMIAHEAAEERRYRGIWRPRDLG